MYDPIYLINEAIHSSFSDHLGGDLLSLVTGKENGLSLAIVMNNNITTLWHQ